MQPGYLGDQQSLQRMVPGSRVSEHPSNSSIIILKWRSQLGGRTILIQNEEGCEATSVPGVSCADLWQDEIVGQNQIMNTNKDCGSEWLMVDGCCR